MNDAETWLGIYQRKDREKLHLIDYWLPGKD